MKFKGIVIGILTAILVTNIVTAYMLVKESQRQTAYQNAQYLILDMLAANPTTDPTGEKLARISMILSSELRGKPSLEGVFEEEP